ncbi:phenylalanine--tRNA ligase beta subunit-related protein [Pseudomonas sp. H11T01]|uniref:phenylalanine--tRNA ligase beta subunit-related protein n=1 Tax=Pseudomonas sp. H11T01 TaxID=3402749 RepID=UPI003ACFEB60
MTNRLIIQKSAADVGANNACAAIIEGITVSSDQSFLPVLTANLNHVASRLCELDSNRVYMGFSHQLQKLGYHKTVSANEKILKSFISKGIRSINNIVDAYNAVAIRNGVSIGVHTYKQANDIHVFRSEKPMSFRPLFAKKEVTIPVGDLVYTSGESPLASIGKADADAHDFRLTDESSSLLVVVLGHEDTPHAFNQAVIEELVDALREKMPTLSYHFLERVLVPEVK